MRASAKVIRAATAAVTIVVITIVVIRCSCHVVLRYAVIAVAGELVFVDVLDGYGGLSEAANFIVNPANFGKVVGATLTGTYIDPGYYHLMTMQTESLAAKGCDAGSFGTINAVFADQVVRRRRTTYLSVSLSLSLSFVY